MDAANVTQGGIARRRRSHIARTVTTFPRAGRSIDRPVALAERKDSNEHDAAGGSTKGTQEFRIRACRYGQDNSLWFNRFRAKPWNG